MLNDAHCHFFSTSFFAALGRGLKDARGAPAETALAKLGWEAPGSPRQLADRWVGELDRHGVARAAIMASVPGDAPSIAAALARHPSRFVGMFMADATEAGAPAAAAAALDAPGVRTICLFPAMHRYSLHDDRVERLLEVAAGRPGTAVFVHCGALSVGARTKLGLPSPFDVRFGNPLDLHAVALAFPSVPFIVPHFGAGLLREALMLADLCQNVHLDTSSSNKWMRYHPGLTLDGVFAQALAAAGPDRILFGTDSSFFPRGWVREVFDEQSASLERLGVPAAVKEKIFGGNFDRLFPPA